MPRCLQPSTRNAQLARAAACRSRKPFKAGRFTCAGLALWASLGLADAVTNNAPDRWRPYANVGLLEDVTLKITWLDSSEELREAAKNSGQQIKETGLKGFSILKRNSETGAYVCHVYAVKMAGALVDGDRTTTFGHEVLHCLGLRHD